MSSNHKAPLAAFVVVAIACVVVLATNSMRSYARDAWSSFASPVVGGLTLVHLHHHAPQHASHAGEVTEAARPAAPTGAAGAADPTASRLRDEHSHSAGAHQADAPSTPAAATATSAAAGLAAPVAGPAGVSDPASVAAPTADSTSGGGPWWSHRDRHGHQDWGQPGEDPGMSAGAARSSRHRHAASGSRDATAATSWAQLTAAASDDRDTRAWARPDAGGQHKTGRGDAAHGRAHGTPTWTACSSGDASGSGSVADADTAATAETAETAGVDASTDSEPCTDGTTRKGHHDDRRH